MRSVSKAVALVVFVDFVDSSTGAWIDNRVEGAASLWTFASADCWYGRFENTADANLFGDVERLDRAKTRCLAGNGFAANADPGMTTDLLFQSTEDMSQLTELGPEGMTVELWGDFGSNPDLQFADLRGREVEAWFPVVGVGQSLPIYAWCKGVDNPNEALAWQIGVFQGKLCLAQAEPYDDSPTGGYRVDDGYECHSTWPITTVGEMKNKTHMVMTLYEQALVMYLDGEEVFSTPDFTGGYSKQTLQGLFNDPDGTGRHAWDPTYKLQFLMDEVGYWSGRPHVPFQAPIYLAAIYTRALNASEVLTNWAAKIPPSDPSCWDSIGTVWEDGELNPGSHYQNPMYYSSRIPASDLSTVLLSAFDQDEDPKSVTYDFNATTAHPMRVFVSRIDPDSRLFTIDDKPIEGCPEYDHGGALELASGVPMPTGLSCEVTRSSFHLHAGTSEVTGDSFFSVKVSPPMNRYSGDLEHLRDGGSEADPLTNFTFWATDGVTHGRSGNTATASVRMDPVNDPPIAASFTKRIIGDSLVSLAMNASDVDGWIGTESYAWASLTILPSQGVVWRYYPNGTLTGAPLGAKNWSSSFLIPAKSTTDDAFSSSTNDDPFFTPPPPTTKMKLSPLTAESLYKLTSEGVKPLPLPLSPVSYQYTTRDDAVTEIAYIFTGNQSALADPVTGVIATDTMQFYVTDIHGVNSGTANISLEIVKGIYAFQSEESMRTVLEEEWGEVRMFGLDETLNPQNLSFKIVTLPLIGTMRDPVTKQVLKAGDVLKTADSWPYTTGVVVEYMAPTNYFNFPNLMWNESRVSGPSGNDVFTFETFRQGKPLFKSEQKEMGVVVVNVNDCPILKVTAPNGVESSTANPDDPHEVPFVWKVKAVGVESEAWKYWDHPKYEDPDLINNFGVWLGDAIDKDVDFIKVRVSAKHGLVGFDRREGKGYDDDDSAILSYFKNEDNKKVLWLNEMDFSSEEYCHLDLNSAKTRDDDVDPLLVLNSETTTRRRLASVPTLRPTGPTQTPSFSPSHAPTTSEIPSMVPTYFPSVSESPTSVPTSTPTMLPTMTKPPTDAPTWPPTVLPTMLPSLSPLPSQVPTRVPSPPTPLPIPRPTTTPTEMPSPIPSPVPTTAQRHDKCKGDGSFDRDMVFLGMPSHVAKVLPSLLYMSSKPFLKDEVTVEVWDGAALGTGCLPSFDFKTQSMRPMCCALKRVMQVEVGDYAFEATISATYALPMGVFAPLLLIPALCYVWWYSARMKRRRLQRMETDPLFRGREERRAAAVAANRTLPEKCCCACLGCFSSTCTLFFCGLCNLCSLCAATCAKAMFKSHQQRWGKEEDANDVDAASEDGGSMELTNRTLEGGLDAAAAASATTEEEAFGGVFGLGEGEGEGEGEEDVLLGEDGDYPVSSSALRFEKIRNSKSYIKHQAQQEDAVKGQTLGGGAAAGERKALMALEGLEESDAVLWEVRYLASGKPLYVHKKTGVRTFDPPKALLLTEHGQQKLLDAASSRPVSTLDAMPVQSDWYEHCYSPEQGVGGGGGGCAGLVYYRHAESGQTSWEDPYECTLKAAAEFHAASAISTKKSKAMNRKKNRNKNQKKQSSPSRHVLLGDEADDDDDDDDDDSLDNDSDSPQQQQQQQVPLVLEDSWKTCVDAEQRVYWVNLVTGTVQWEEPGTSHIRQAIRDAEKEAARRRVEYAEETEANEVAALLASQMQGDDDAQSGGEEEGGLMRRATALFMKGSGGSSGSAESGGMSASFAGRMRKSFFGGSKKDDILKKGGRRSKLDRAQKSGMGRDALDDDSDEEVPTHASPPSNHLEPANFPGKNLAVRMAAKGGQPRVGFAPQEVEGIEHQNYL